MTQASIDVVGIGNAIVDVIAHAEDAFLAQEALVKGTMTLVDAARAEALYRMMGPAIEASGGSAGNTMAAPSGTTYPGGGNPIGTSMLFSHLAVRDMLGRTDSVSARGAEAAQ